MANLNLGFQKRLSLGFTSISLLSMMVFGVFSYYFTSSLVRALTLDDLNNQIKGVESAIQVTYEDNLDRQRGLADLWAKKIIHQIDIRESDKQLASAENQVNHEKSNVQVPTIYINGKKILENDFVDQLSQETNQAVTLFVKIPEGFYRASTSIKKSNGSRFNGTFIPTASPISESLMKGERYLGRAQVAGNWYTTSYDPILKNGQVVGSFFMGTRETSFEKIKNYLKSQKILKTGYFYILDSAGQLVLHPSKEGENVLGTTDLDGKKIFKQIIDQKTGSIEYHWLNAETKTPQNKIAIFRYFPQMDWFVAASINEDEAQEATAKLKWILFFIAAGMISMTALATVVFGKYVAEKLITISSGLKTSGEEVSLSSEQLEKVSQNLARATENQASSLQETVSAIEEIRSMIKRNLEGTATAESLSKEMAEAAETSQNKLRDLAEKVGVIATTNDNLQTEMKTSHQQMERIIDVISNIGEKTKVINEIVFQTKLLSFNASVEAARAGENGKGFAVVAEEVGRLAALSGSASEEIRANLESSQSEVKMIIEQAKKRTENLISQAKSQIHEGVKISQECSSNFAHISQQTSQTHIAVEGIAHASKEQTQGIEEINTAMLAMDKVTQQNSTAAQQVKALAEQLNSDSTKMETLVRSLSGFLSGTS